MAIEPDAQDWETSSNVGAPLPGQTLPQEFERSQPESTPAPTPAADVPVAAEAVADEPDETPEAPAESTERDRKGRFTRHRAQSQKASAEDVPRIRELTKKWRTAEDSLTKLRTEFDTFKAQHAPKPPAPVVPPAPTAFTKTEPKFEDFASEADQLTAYYRAVARYDAEKADYEKQQAAHATAKADADKHTQNEQERIWNEKKAKYGERLTAFKATTPDYDQVLAAGPQGQLSDAPILACALIEDDNGPALVYHLAKHPALFDEMFLVASGKPVTPESVAAMRRLLQARTQAAPTRSAAPTPQVLVPTPPPNLVRTGPMKPAADVPGDDASLEEHERAFPVRRSLRR